MKVNKIEKDVLIKSLRFYANACQIVDDPAKPALPELQKLIKKVESLER